MNGKEGSKEYEFRPLFSGLKSMSLNLTLQVENRLVFTDGHRIKEVFCVLCEVGET